MTTCNMRAKFMEAGGSCAALLALFLVSSTASAATVRLKYTSNKFNTYLLFIDPSTSPPTPKFKVLPDPAANSVIGTMVLAAPLDPGLAGAIITPASFSFTNGPETFTQTDSDTDSFFAVSTDTSGNIVNWRFSIVRSQNLAGGGIKKEVSSQNVPGLNSFDQGVERFCGSGSTVSQCLDAVPGFYIQYGLVENSPGVWTKNDLTITAPNIAAMPYGSAIPISFSPTYSSGAFAPGDTASKLVSATTQPTCTTTATEVSVPGSYPITCSGAIDTEYQGPFTYVPNTLTIVQAPSAISITSNA